MQTNTCMVCGWDGLSESPYNEKGLGSYEICSSCGFEFGYDDDPSACGDAPLTSSKEQMIELYRNKWIDEGMKWQSREDSSSKPEGWDPREQLKNIGIEL